MAQTNFKYPANLTQPPFEKWILFEVKRGRHVLRNQVIAEDGTNIDETLASASLYLPDSALNDSLSVAYSQNDLGPFVGAAVELLAQSGQNLMNGGLKHSVENDSGGLIQKLGSAVGTANKIITAIQSTWKDALKAEAQTKLNTLLDGGAAAVFGQRPNPRTDVLFNAQEYRNHELEFLMVPRNLQEAQSIDQIIHLFQYYMLPAYLNQNQNQLGSFLIGFPYEFEITILNQFQELDHVNKFERSILKNCTIDHAAGEKVAFIEDPNGDLYPVMTKMTLTFQEVRLLGRDSDVLNRGLNTSDPLPDPRLRPQS